MTSRIADVLRYMRYHSLKPRAFQAATLLYAQHWVERTAYQMRLEQFRAKAARMSGISDETMKRLGWDVERVKSLMPQHMP